MTTQTVFLSAKHKKVCSKIESLTMKPWIIGSCMFIIYHYNAIIKINAIPNEIMSHTNTIRFMATCAYQWRILLPFSDPTNLHRYADMMGKTNVHKQAGWIINLTKNQVIPVLCIIQSSSSQGPFLSETRKAFSLNAIVDV